MTTEIPDVRHLIIHAMTNREPDPYTDTEADELLDTYRQYTRQTAVIKATIATLRTVASWLPDEQRDLLYEAATVAENGGWEDACCPVCQETFCDGGCPLEEVRAEMYEREAAEAKKAVEQEGQCDGRHPLVRRDGTQVYLYDLVTHNGCPHQPWAHPAKTDQELADALWPAWTPFRRAIPGVTSSYRQRPVLPEGCYTASFGRVHVRPGCRC